MTIDLMYTLISLIFITQLLTIGTASEWRKVFYTSHATDDQVWEAENNYQLLGTSESSHLFTQGEKAPNSKS